MNQQDWIDYFEAVNGRSPEAHELEAARQAQEFIDAAPVEEASPVVPHVETVSQPQAQEATPHAGMAYQQQVPPTEPTRPTQAAYTADPSGQPVPPTGQFQQAYTGGPQGQPAYAQPIPVAPSPFALFWKQFWNWLVASWKNPTTHQTTHRYNGMVACGLLAFLTTLTTTFTFSAGSFDFAGFISSVLAFALIIFAFVLAGFVVKKVVYQEAHFTLAYSFEWFGRLLSSNIFLMAAAALFALLKVYSLVGLLTGLSYIIFGAASAYTLYHPKNHSRLDLFYKYILASLLFSVIVFILAMIAFSIAGEMLFRGIVSDFPGYMDYNGYNW